MAKELIKYEGDNTVFVWKHPCQEFNTNTKLIVNESLEALFMSNGQALDLFGPGSYILEVEKIPKIKQFFYKLFGKEQPVTEFQCDIYFINKTEQMAIKWGTDSKVQFMEPTYGFPLSIGASGEMSIRIEDSKKFLVKLVGTESILTQQRLTQYFRAFLMTKVKSYIAQTIKVNKISIFEIDENLQNFSNNLLSMLKPDFAEYGLSLERFFVTNIVKPDGESQYEKFKTLHFRQYADVMEAQLRQKVNVIDAQTDAQKIIIESQALAQKRLQEGYTYQQERGFDIAAKIAQNDTVGQFANIGLGLGSMSGVGTSMAGIINNTIQNTMSNFNPANVPTADNEVSKNAPFKCPICGEDLSPNAKFCLNCGQKIEPVAEGNVICPECGKMVLKGKFCPECGHKFDPICPNCGAETKGGKFCLQCGQKL